MAIVFNQSKPPSFLFWHNDKNKNNLFYKKSPCNKICDYYLITNSDHLLPFQINVDISSTGFYNVNSIILYSLDGTCQYSLPLYYTEIVNGAIVTRLNIVFTAANGIITAVYNGSPFDNLPCGIFTMEVTINGVIYYFEPISIIKIIPEFVSNERILLLENSEEFLLEDGSGFILLE